ncbi:MAG: septation protein A [Rhodospirillaceae bacterium]|jgi:intracellular septation protein|nr:septation protein A [Rhodospirillaceae bacterium]MBT3808875.1 septation protein A [Rhodospirillaceae bacterium]MBT3930243.1 septation protein A [Rhodospirillaceae bacterium]MBT4773330.1 septation protein A [Rhodospirillaceae bacterium]MBT5769961.1 septation protein A [Rhodospirillaceae bacterium]
MRPWIKLIIEAGPLVVFFVVNGRDGLPEFRNLWLPEGGSLMAEQSLFEATGAFMVATLLALVTGWVLERRLPVMPLVSGIFVVFFGGLTLVLADETFIKLKPTLVNTLFAVILFGGLLTGRSLLKPLFGAAVQLTDQGWRKLTLRWAIFFVVLAVLNEIVWRNFTTDFWVSFKLFGIMPLTFLFAASQTPLFLREQIEDAVEPSSSSD